MNGNNHTMERNRLWRRSLYPVQADAETDVCRTRSRPPGDGVEIQGGEGPQYRQWGRGEDQMLRVMLRSSHCWERLLLQSLRVGTSLSSSDGMSKHWLLFTCSKVSR